MTALTRPPRISLVSLPVLDAIDGRLLVDRDERDTEHCRDSDLTGYDLTSTSFAECDFSSVTPDDAQLRGLAVLRESDQ